MTDDDLKLVKAYAANRSETAFAALVGRYTNFVYSAALRQARDAHQAEEVTQAVFIILARKAGSLGPKIILSGWLYRTTYYVARGIQKREARRRRLEQEAYMESATQNLPTDTNWDHLAPVLDEAMLRLRDKERDAILLRYFENKNLREVGTALGVEERAAQKRVTRGLEKLRGFFAKRGVVLSATTIAGMVAANSVHAAPTGLAMSAAVAAKGAAVSSSTFTLIKGALKIMAWTKVKTAVVIGVAAVLTAGTATVVVKAVAGGSTLASNPSWADDPKAWRTDSKVLEKNPPVLILRPTRFPHDGGGITMTGPNRFLVMSKNATLKGILASAYQMSLARIVFPDDLPSERYDVMVTLKEKGMETLKAELNQRFGLTAEGDTRDTEVLLLHVSNPNAPGLKLATTSDNSAASWTSGTREITIKGQVFTGFAGSLEGRFGKPVIDRTGLDQRYNIHVKWDPQPGESDNDAYERALKEQLGLELVPSHEPMTMLVIEHKK